MSFKTGHLQVDGSMNIDGSVFFSGIVFNPSLNLSAVNQDYLPKVGSLINIGASTNRIDKIYANDVYISQSSLWVNGKKVISDESDVITVSTSPNQDLLMLTSGSGTSKVQSATGILLNVTNTYTSKDIELRTDSNSGSIILDANGNNSPVFVNATGNIEINSKATLKLIGNNITFDSSTPLSFTNLSVSNFTAASLLATGDTSLYGTLHVGGHTHIGGNLTVDGSLVYTNINSVNVSTGYIQLSTGITGTPPSTLQSGIIVNRGTSNPYVFVYDEDQQTFRIGISTLSSSTHYSDASTQAVATREDSPNNWGIGFWNNSAYRMDTSAGFTFTPGTGLGLPIASTMSTENTVLVWNGTTVGSRDLGTMAFETSINYYSKTMVDGVLGSYATKTAFIPNSSIGVSGGVLAYRTFGTASAADIGSGGVLAYRTFGTAANSNTGDFVAARTFGTAANSNTGDFVAARTFGTAANNNTGDFLGATAKAADTTLLDGMASSRFIYGSNVSGSNTASATYNPYEISQYKSGFFEINGATWAPTTGWYWGLTASHTSNNASPGYNYSMQLIAENGTSNFHMRTVSAGSPNPWRRLWHNGDTTITANITGNVTGNVSGSSGSCTGNTSGSSGSCTGDAHSVDGQHFAWSNNSNSPTYLWAADSNGSAYLAARGSMSVASAASAGSASSAGYAGYLSNSYAYTNGTDGWFRSSGNAGWFNATYSVGVYSIEAGYVDAYNGAVFRAPNFKLSSDASLKTNVQPIDIKGIDIEYKQFELKSRPGEVRYGVIAQDLEKVNPELVSKGADGMLSVSYIDLLIKEIVALKARVEELENRI